MLRPRSNYLSKSTLLPCVQVYTAVVYTQCLVYWACTKLYSTQQIYSQHRPGVGSPGSPNFPGLHSGSSSSTCSSRSSTITMEGKSALNATEAGLAASGDAGVERNGVKDPFAKEKELLSWQWCEACQVGPSGGCGAVSGGSLWWAWYGVRCVPQVVVVRFASPKVLFVSLS